jgi:hypothetical protein
MKCGMATAVAPVTTPARKKLRLVTRLSMIVLR